MPRGRPEDFERAMLPFLADCRGFALSLVGNPHDADDLVQETYWRAQRGFDRFEVGTNAKAWLFTILRRLAVDRHRRLRRRPALLPEEELAEAAVAPSPQESEALDRATPQEVRAALEAVPEPFRLPVRLRDLDGLSYRHIGEILDIPPGTVMSRLSRGREWMRRLLVERKDDEARHPRKPET